MATRACFTIDEANALIPRLEMLMARMQHITIAIRSAVHDSPEGDVPEVHTTTDVLRVRPDLAPHVRDLEEIVDEIERLGCQFKGLDLGLVDFPAMADGVPILLCWQYGEKQIAYWHQVDEGFTSRRALRAADLPRLQ